MLQQNRRGSVRRFAAVHPDEIRSKLAERLGPDASAEIANMKGDTTHFNEKGGRAMAGLVMRELPAAEPMLKKYLKVP